MGRTDDDTAEASAGLHLLDTHYREHPQTGPTGRRATNATPGTPLNIGIVDHITRCVAEVVDHARTEAPKPTGPLPDRVADIYDWYLQHTADAGPEARLRRDIIIKRQQMEHAIALGDHKVVRTHWCPGCRTLGLKWNSHARRAMCLNGRCLDRHGAGRSWTLARLATQYILDQEIRARRAT
ncbi:hypothetical protein [Streptomyces sp. NPDC060001]|uniref:hypothetical protein n=1 Tax=Streptomyces sp. NPDC060001 TaxID=3347032 RepID=UPI0036CA26D2